MLICFTVTGRSYGTKDRYALPKVSYFVSDANFQGDEYICRRAMMPVIVNVDTYCTADIVVTRFMVIQCQSLFILFLVAGTRTS